MTATSKSIDARAIFVSYPKDAVSIGNHAFDVEDWAIVYDGYDRHDGIKEWEELEPGCAVRSEPRPLIRLSI